MRRLIWLLIASAVFPVAAFSQTSLSIDRLERKTLAQASTEVAFSTVLEGTVGSPDLAVSVLVYQPHLKAWRVFPAATERKPEAAGRYRWRAICQFGELDGRGKGDQYKVRVVAVDPADLVKAVRGPAVETGTITLKRVK
jgi:hypothetical protein